MTWIKNMDSFRKPEMIIAIIALVALIAISIYFYKKIGFQQQKTNEIGTRLQETVKVLPDIDLRPQINELVKQMKSRDVKIAKQQDTIKLLSKELRDMKQTLSLFTETLGTPMVSSVPAIKKKKPVTPPPTKPVKVRKDDLLIQISDSEKSESEKEETDTENEEEEKKDESDVEKEDEISRQIARVRAARNQ